MLKFYKSKFLGKIIEYQEFSCGKNPEILVLMNDGQDFEQLNLVQHLEDFSKKQRPSFQLVAINADHRIQDYGVAERADYKNRGANAGKYSQFILNELIPFLKQEKAINHIYFFGFSLGGLSAFDMVWNNPEIFQKVGVFSGSFWWRSKAYEDGYVDVDRIMHQQILKLDGKNRKHQQFWLQTGTLDETEDRNNNGVIDSIDDTLDLILVMKAAGISSKQITYFEVENGEHNFKTWSEIFPEFLDWLIPKHFYIFP